MSLSLRDPTALMYRGGLLSPSFGLKSPLLDQRGRLALPQAPVAGQGPPTTGTASVTPSLRELYFLLRQDLQDKCPLHL